jgi:hypothetical protein
VGPCARRGHTGNRLSRSSAVSVVRGRSSHIARVH